MSAPWLWQCATASASCENQPSASEVLNPPSSRSSSPPRRRAAGPSRLSSEALGAAFASGSDDALRTIVKGLNAGSAHPLLYRAITASRRIGLRKDDDAPDNISIRPIAIGDALARAAASCAVRDLDGEIARWFTRPMDDDPDGVATMCAVPRSCPDLPQKVMSREGPLNALVASLIENDTRTVSLTAPKCKRSTARTKVASQGMVSHPCQV